MNKPKYYAFYGSLRKAHYNHKRLFEGASGVEEVGADTIPAGYTMYNLGPYPMVVTDEKSTNPLVLEIYAISNPRLIDWIDGMESGAGYEEKKVMLRDFCENQQECTLWVGRNSERLQKTPVVTSGDWTAFNAEKPKNEQR